MPVDPPPLALRLETIWLPMLPTVLVRLLLALLLVRLLLRLLLLVLLPTVLVRPLLLLLLPTIPREPMEPMVPLPLVVAAEVALGYFQSAPIDGSTAASLAMVAMAAWAAEGLRCSKAICVHVSRRVTQSAQTSCRSAWPTSSTRARTLFQYSSKARTEQDHPSSDAANCLSF